MNFLRTYNKLSNKSITFARNNMIIIKNQDVKCRRYKRFS